jgi:pimeloyl-ACP methyl ester carboxylesterase
MSPMPPLRLLAVLAAAALAQAPAAAQQPATADAPHIEMRDCALPGGAGTARCGTYWALENREQPGGRRIPLDVMVIPARGPNRRPDPVFFALGGPGQTSTTHAAAWTRSPLHQERDLVLVDFRGTSPAHALDCRLGGSMQNLQGYLEPIFDTATFRRCREELEGRADLTRYLTSDYVDDLDEVRRALGYGQININGGSYGSRVVLFYLRQYPGSVRTAFATGLAPITSRSPLHNSAEAQAVLDSVFALCARDAGCGGAFPDVRREFEETMERLRREPAHVTIQHPETGAAVPLAIDANAFAEGLRVLMYDWENSRRLPLLLHRAYGGDYLPFTLAALENNAGIRDALRFGLLMSVACGEDVHRITEEEIVRETRGTFLGDLRVRTQKAACDTWPRRPLPAGYTDPVRSDVPTLLVSGAYDPSTGPRWGDDAVRTLSNGLHMVLPGAHTADSGCLDRITLEFLDRASVQGLDTSCIAEMKLAPFVLVDEPRPQSGH